MDRGDADRHVYIGHEKKAKTLTSHRGLGSSGKIS